MSDGPMYWDFSTRKVRGVSAYDRALVHARLAEELMANVKEGVYMCPPHNITAAQAHAQLATAWATVALVEKD